MVPGCLALWLSNIRCCRPVVLAVKRLCATSAGPLHYARPKFERPSTLRWNRFVGGEWKIAVVETAREDVVSSSGQTDDVRQYS